MAWVRDILAELAAAKGHLFWSDSVSLLEVKQFDLAGAVSKNLTDLYLLRLASASDGRLITFDRKIRWQWVSGCEEVDLKSCQANLPDSQTRLGPVRRHHQSWHRQTCIGERWKSRRKAVLQIEYNPQNAIPAFVRLGS